MFQAASAVAVAALFFAPAVLRAAKGDAEVIVAADHTEAGKKFVQPTAQKPAYCMFISAGAQQLGAVIANDKIPAQQEVEPQVLKALARQFYLPVDEMHPKPEYVIVYSWGSINPDNMDADGNSTDDDAALPQTQLNQQQMLSVVATNKLDLAPNGVDRHLFLPSLSDGRYFILVGAYDYAALAAGKPRKQAMLWRTRLSIYNSTNADLAAAIPMMLDAAPGAFGADGYPKSVVGKLREGHVNIGEAKVVGYITSSGSMIPAEAAPVVSGSGAAVPLAKPDGNKSDGVK